MKLKVQQVMDALVALTTIISEKRKMPQRAKYCLARMHTKLTSEFADASKQRDELIMAYDHVEEGTGRNIVPPDKVAEFAAAWKEIGDTEIEVDVEPIPISFFSTPDNNADGPINADEIIQLGDLMTGD